MRAPLAPLLFVAAGCSPSSPPPDLPPIMPGFGADSVAQLVDPFIGTANEGNTFPGAVLPFGMVSLSPHNKISTPVDYLRGRSIAPSGYVDGEPAIMGFGATHLSGVGCPELGAPVIAATTGELSAEPDGWASAYANERAWPGYYGVDLKDFTIRADMTVTRRAGVIRFEFPGGRKGDANVFVDAGQALAWRAGNGAIRFRSPTELEGSTETGLFCAAPNRQRVYFAVRLDRKAESMGTWTDGSIGNAMEAAGRAGAWLRFSTDRLRVVEVRVAVSFVSVENAWASLDREVENRGFDALRLGALAAWEKTLGRIRVSGEDPARRTIFYTALYHALIHPSLASDGSGDHPRFGGGVVKSDPVERYHVHSLWDTYRNVHPLLSLVYPETQALFLRGLAAMTVEAGAPPRWELAGSETNIMVGDPALIVFGDGLAKKLVDFDLGPAYEAMRAAALDVDSKSPHRPGNKSYQSLGYVPIEEGEAVWGPVSTTLEYALADFNLARIADSLGRTKDADRFRAQSGNWLNLFDANTGFLRPRRADGSWLDPFNPDALTGSNGQYRNAGGPGYVEGTAWHYNFFVPHDVPGLIAKLGGEAAFAARRCSLRFRSMGGDDGEGHSVTRDARSQGPPAA